MRIDSRAVILAGGESGPAIVPNVPNESLLINAVNYESLEMPPNNELSKNQIRILNQWIQMGAPWPDSEEVALVPRPHGLTITDEDREFWAFRPIVRPTVPNAEDAVWGNHPIDGFIYRRLCFSGFSYASASRTQPSYLL